MERLKGNKLFVISDKDGTLFNINHRTHFVRGGNHQWNEFFEDTDKDEPVWDVMHVVASHINAGHRVEIWSGACESSYEKSAYVLNKYMKDMIDWGNLDYDTDDVGQFLTRMRPKGDNTPDQELKRKWLNSEDSRPDIMYDDRKKVCEMYREEGLTVARVVGGDFDSENKFETPRKAKLTVMIGPSGAGKDYWLQFNSPAYTIVSSDNIRWSQFPSEDSFCDPAAYTHEGFKATFSTANALIEANLKGGIDVVYNATNIKARNRKDMLKAVGADTGKYDVDYVIVDRPLDEKIKSFSDDTGRTSIDIINKHHQSFQSSKKHALKGDGFDFINVIDATNFDAMSA